MCIGKPSNDIIIFPTFSKKKCRAKIVTRMEQNEFFDSEIISQTIGLVLKPILRNLKFHGKNCFKKIVINEKIPTKYLNYSARNIKYKKKLSFYKKYIKYYNDNLGNGNELVAIITPDKEIVENSNLYSPAYLIYDNYEIILKWNRSLRFALAVCTLKDRFKNEL